MKIAASTVAAAAFAFALATSTHAGEATTGLVSYWWEFSSPTAQAGDTVGVTLMAEVDPFDAPFYALADSSFDIFVTDPLNDSSLANNALHPAFSAAGDLGTLGTDEITGVLAGQLPPFINPLIDTGTLFELYTFEYTVDGGGARTVDFTVDVGENWVYTGTGPQDLPLQYDTTSTVGQLEVTAVPAPGALALLGLAGVCAGRRRRRTTSNG